MAEKLIIDRDLLKPIEAEKINSPTGPEYKKLLEKGLPEFKRSLDRYNLIPEDTQKIIL